MSQEHKLDGYAKAEHNNLAAGRVGPGQPPLGSAVQRTTSQTIQPVKQPGQ